MAHMRKGEGRQIGPDLLGLRLSVAGESHTQQVLKRGSAETSTGEEGGVPKWAAPLGTF